LGRVLAVRKMAVAVEVGFHLRSQNGFFVAFQRLTPKTDREAVGQAAEKTVAVLGHGTVQRKLSCWCRPPIDVFGCFVKSERSTAMQLTVAEMSRSLLR
jgi:hypothetical protein